MKLKLTFYLMLFCTFMCVSQNQASKWHFGQYSGLDFMTTPPTVISSSLAPFEGCASIADALGNALFYTDGLTVYNQQHLVMANGSGLAGGNSTTQPALIIKQPGNNNMHYVFTLGDFGGALSYSTVDMSLAAGLGSVTAKNLPLYAPSTEKLTAVKHCNGIDVWVITHDYNNNNFRCHLLTSSGVSLLPVISAVGTIHTGTDSFAGYLKASPNGKKLGLAITGLNYFELYDFDPSTGIVSNPLPLLNILWPYGCEFSSDGTKFYGTQEGVNNLIYQWDLCAGSNTAIVASKYIITTAQNLGLYGMQIALNGKIYVARAGQTLCTINNPNVAGVGCNFVDLGQSIAPSYCGLGLPNFVSSYFNPPPTPFLSSTPACGATVSFSATSETTSITNCNASEYFGGGILWNFGDPNSGASNFSGLSNPSHVYSGLGTFTVQLIRSYPCRNDTLKQLVTITNSIAPTLGFTGQYNICNTQTANITATLSTGQPALSYSWSPGNITTASVSLSPAVTTVYTVTVVDQNNCVLTQTMMLITSPCTDIAEQNVFMGIKIYPNPNDGNFRIETNLKTFSYHIANGLGIVVDSDISETGDKWIDLNKLPDGVYFLQLSNEGRKQRFKLMKIN